MLPSRTPQHSSCSCHSCVTSRSCKMIGEASASGAESCHCGGLYSPATPLKHEMTLRRQMAMDSPGDRLWRWQSSSPQPEKQAFLRKWFLIRLDEPSSATGSLQVALGGWMGTDFVKTAPVVDRIDKNRLRTIDGVEVRLVGLIDEEKTISSGFSAWAANFFLSGFPCTWKRVLQDDSEVSKMTKKVSDARRSLGTSHGEEITSPCSKGEPSIAAASDCQAASEAPESQHVNEDPTVETTAVIEELVEAGAVEAPGNESNPATIEAEAQALSVEPVTQSEEALMEAQSEAGAAEAEQTTEAEKQVNAELQQTVAEICAEINEEPAERLERTDDNPERIDENPERTDENPQVVELQKEQEIMEEAVTEEDSVPQETEATGAANVPTTAAEPVESVENENEVHHRQNPKTAPVRGRKRSVSRPAGKCGRRRKSPQKRLVEAPRKRPVEAPPLAPVDSTGPSCIEEDRDATQPEQQIVNMGQASVKQAALQHMFSSSNERIESAEQQASTAQSKHVKRRKKRSSVLPPPLPASRVKQDDVIEAYGLKTSRSGRLLVPPLAFWRNQTIAHDKDGGVIAILDGFHEPPSDTGCFNFKPPTEKRRLQQKLCAAAWDASGTGKKKARK